MNIKQRRLPSAYQEVEWIKSDGMCWIDLGFTITAETGLKTKIKEGGSSYVCYFGVVDNGSIPFALRKLDYLQILDYPNYILSILSTQYDASSEYEIEYNYNNNKKFILTQGETNVTLNLGTRNASSVSLYLFAQHYENYDSWKGDQYQYEMIFTEGSTISHNVIPCYRISDNVIGVYDLTIGRFSTNTRGGGVLTKGPDVVTLESMDIPEGNAIKITDSANNVLWQKKYGGIAVGIDNKCYDIYTTNAKWNESLEFTNNFFISEFVDSGNANSKSITYGYQNVETVATTRMRIFNDKNATSIDYWNVMATPRTSNIVGRYYAISIRKNEASHFYVYDNTNQRYLLKGDMVN